MLWMQKVLEVWRKIIFKVLYYYKLQFKKTQRFFIYQRDAKWFWGFYRISCSCQMILVNFLENPLDITRRINKKTSALFWKDALVDTCCKRTAIVVLIQRKREKIVWYNKFVSVPSFLILLLVSSWTRVLARRLKS